MIFYEIKPELNEPVFDAEKQEPIGPAQAVREYLGHFDLTVKSAAAEEITMSAFCSLASRANSGGFIVDDSEVVDFFRLPDLSRRHG